MVDTNTVEYTRRKLLLGIGAGGSMALAGCAGGRGCSSNGSCVTCEGTVINHAKGDVLQLVGPDVEQKNARLRIHLGKNAVEQTDGNINTVAVYGANGTQITQASVPPNKTPSESDQFYIYHINIGETPLRSQYRVIVENANGNLVDEMTVKIRCNEKRFDQSPFDSIAMVSTISYGGRETDVPPT